MRDGRLPMSGSAGTFNSVSLRSLRRRRARECIDDDGRLTGWNRRVSERKSRRLIERTRVDLLRSPLIIGHSPPLAAIIIAAQCRGVSEPLGIQGELRALSGSTRLGTMVPKPRLGRRRLMG